MRQQPHELLAVTMIFGCYPLMGAISINYTLTLALNYKFGLSVLKSMSVIPEVRSVMLSYKKWERLNAVDKFTWYVCVCSCSIPYDK